MGWEWNAEMGGMVYEGDVEMVEMAEMRRIIFSLRSAVLQVCWRSAPIPS